MKIVDLKPHGFVAPEITPDQYTLGANLVPQDIQMLDGQWTAYLPEDEYQLKNGLEVYNCTAFGTLNAIEILAKRKFGQIWNKSERFLGTMAGTRPPGNNPHTVCETVRKTGLADDELLPFSPEINTIDEYYSTLDISGVVTSNAEKWLKQYAFKHEWVWAGFPSVQEKQEKLKEALKYSPVCVSVCAWKKNGDLYYKELDDSDNHWTLLYGYEDGKHWKIFDSYDDSTKELEWDYNFLFAKRFHLEKLDAQKTNWVQDMWISLLSFFKDVVKLKR